MNKYSKSTRILLQILLFLLIVFIPSNLFLNLSPQAAYVSGLKVDYLIPKMWASEIIILNILWIWLLHINIKKINKEKIKKFIIDNKFTTLLSFIILARQLFTPRPISSIFFLLQLLLNIFFIFFLKNHRWLFKKQIINWAVACSATTQFCIAIYQFINQHPLLPYQLFGEPRFEPYFRMSRHLFDGKERILSYGSTAHPNVLAGSMVIFCLILLIKITKRHTSLDKILWVISLIFTLILLYTTQSLSALLTLVFGGTVVVVNSRLITSFYKKVFNKFLIIFLLISLLFSPFLIFQLSKFYPQEPSITRRHMLNKMAVNIFKKEWLVGSGINQFTLYLDNFSNQAEIVRFVQPVHHVGLLLFAETGIVGLLLFIQIIKTLSKSDKNTVLLTLSILTPLLVLDHYLFTLQTGQLLFSLLFIVLDSRLRSGSGSGSRSWHNNTRLRS